MPTFIHVADAVTHLGHSLRDDAATCVCEQIGRSVNLQNMTVSHTVGDPLDYSALTNLDFHECAPRHTALPDHCQMSRRQAPHGSHTVPYKIAPSSRCWMERSLILAIGFVDV